MQSTTIVVPAHNAAPTISETLNSILAQTQGNWNAIIVDDGSTDGTADAVRRFLPDPRFKLLSKAAGGVSSARNAGSAMAAAPWLVFLDADDMILPDYLAEMHARVEGADEDRPAAVYCSSRRLLPDGRLGAIYRPPQTDHLSHLLGSNIFPNCVSLMVSRDAFDRLGGFREDLIAGEDWELWIRLFRSRRKVEEVDKPLVLYRMQPGSLTRHPRAMLSSLLTVIAEVHETAMADLPDGDLAGRAQLKQRMHRTTLGVSIWCYGITVGLGRPDRSLVIAPAPMPDIDPAGMANSFIEGVAHGSCLLRSDWPILWQQHRTGIEQDFAALGHDDISRAFWAACLVAISG